MKTTICIATYPGDKHFPAILDRLKEVGIKNPTLSYDPTNQRSFAANNNFMASKADSEFLLFLNSDIIPTKDFLSELEMALTLSPNIGVVGPKILFAESFARMIFIEGKPHMIKGTKGQLQCAGIMYTKGSLQPYEYGMGEDPEGAVYNKAQAVGGITGACMLVRRKEFLDLGGFDENFVNGWEDSDLCNRYVEINKIPYYVPSSVVSHFYSVSPDRHKKEEKNRKYWFDKWHETGRIYQSFFNIPKGIKNVDIGCGGVKKEGYYGIDKNFVKGQTDHIMDLDEIATGGRLPFGTSQLDNLYCAHVLEHLTNLVAMMNEFHRVLSTEGTLHIVVPHFVSWAGIASPFHKMFFVPETFRMYFASDMIAELRQTDPEMEDIQPWHIVKIEETPVPAGMDPFKVQREIVVIAKPLKEVKQ